MYNLKSRELEFKMEVSVGLIPSEAVEKNLFEVFLLGLELVGFSLCLFPLSSL